MAFYGVRGVGVRREPPFGVVMVRSSFSGDRNPVDPVRDSSWPPKPAAPKRIRALRAAEACRKAGRQPLPPREMRPKRIPEMARSRAAHVNVTARDPRAV